jgi:membrane-associated protease RseP (regulator of RpoE activity)
MVVAMGDSILDVLASIAPSLDQASGVQIAFVAAIVCVIGLPLLTLIHELGHAIAVRLRGLPLESLVVGDADDLILRIGGVTLRFGRMLDGDADAGFVRYDAAQASPDDRIVIALAGPAANLVVAPVFAGLAAIGGTSGPFDACLWLLAAVSVVLAVVDLVPSGTPGTSTSISDGRVVQLAWAARRGPVLHWTEPEAEPPAPSLAAEAPSERHGSFRWPFVTALFLVAVIAFTAGGPTLLMPLILVFGLAFLQGAHRDKLW